jgi:hypothetical protein
MVNNALTNRDDGQARGNAGRLAVSGRARPGRRKPARNFRDGAPSFERRRHSIGGVVNKLFTQIG